MAGFFYPGLMQPPVPPEEQAPPPALSPTPAPAPNPHLVLPPPQNLDEAMAETGMAGQKVLDAEEAKRNADKLAKEQLPQRLKDAGLPTMEEGLHDQETALAANETYRQERLSRVNQDAQLLRAEQQRYGDMRPQTVFQRAPTWGKVALGIAMIAGGALSGYANPRSGNPFLKAINDIIEQDTDRQEKDIAQAGRVLDFRTRQNRQERADAESEFETTELSRAKKWELVKQQIQQVANTATSDQAKADLALAEAQAEQKIVESYEKMAMRKAQLDISVENSKRTAYVNIMGIRNRTAMDNVEETGRNVRHAEDLGAAMVRGAAPYKQVPIGNPTTGEDIGKAPVGLAEHHIKTINTITQAWTLVDRIQRESKELSIAQRRPDFLGSGDPHWQAIDADFAALNGIMKSPEFLNLGASLVARELGILQGNIGKGPDTWLRADPAARLERAQQQIEDRARIYANTAKLKYFLPEKSQETPQPKRFGREMK